jgi:tetrahydromethanopterin S-methyltransferase subunit G
MTKDITPDEMIKKLKRMNMTPEEIKKEEARELGEKLGKLIGAIFSTAIIATIIWAVLAYIFTVAVTWLQVWGGLILFNLLINGIIAKVK